MLNIDMTEWIGYLASGVVMISFLMKKIHRLRIVNSCGALLFAIYGILLSSWPIIITNVFILGINFYYLIKFYQEKKQQRTAVESKSL